MKFSGCQLGGLVPLGEGADTMDVTVQGVVDGGWRDEEVADGGEDGDEALAASGRAEFLHDSFAFSQWQMTVLRPVVQSLVGQMPERELQFPSGRTVGSQFVGDHARGPDTLLFQQPRQQTPGGFGGPAALQDLVKDIAILINGAPQPMWLAMDHDLDLVEMPDITGSGGLTAQRAGKGRAELLAPATDRFIRHNETAFEQHLLNQAETQRKPEIQPYRMRDHFAWKTMPFVAHNLFAHHSSLSHYR